MAPSPAPEVLRMYTGRFERVREGRKVARVVITLDEKQLRIGYIANGPGAIINGIDITMDGIPRFIIGGVGSDDVQAMAKTRPGDNTVLFTTRNEDHGRDDRQEDISARREGRLRHHQAPAGGARAYLDGSPAPEATAR